MRTARHRARTLALAAAGRGARSDDPGGRRAGAAVPEPARLCAAHPVPHLRPPLRLSQLHGLAGRAPPLRPPAMPSLRPCRSRCPRPARPARRPTAWSPAAPASSGSPRRSPRASPRRAARSWRATPCPVRRPRPELIARFEAARGRPPDRHPGGRQGPPLPAADRGRRGRRRSGPGRRRPARHGAHLAASAPGRRPRRARGPARPGLPADLRARPPGDGGAGLRRPRPFPGTREARPGARRHAAVTAGWPASSSRAPTRARSAAWPRSWRATRHAATASRPSARRRRRCPCCGAASAGACS